jgi:transcription initiation factor IIE alpha subunit
MDLSDLGESLSEMSEQEIRAKIQRLRRDRRVSGNRVAKKRKEAVKRRATNRISADALSSGTTLDEKKQLVEMLRKALGKDK